MAAKKRGLGRGLDALLGSAARPAAVADNTAPSAPPELRSVPTGDSPPPAPASPTDGTLCSLPVDVIQRGKYQPRRDIEPESLQELADSIKAQGVMQPIVLRPRVAGGYEIIAGERRWRAAQKAGVHDVPVVIRDADDQEAFELALVENLQREDLGPLEEAVGYQQLDEQSRTVRYLLEFDPHARKQALDRFERLVLYATPYRDMG